MKEMLDLSPFAGGSDKVYAYNFSLGDKIVITNGVKYIADKCGAYWFVDIIISYQTHDFKDKNPFQTWTLESNNKDGAVVTCEDGNENKILTKEIPFTDFPFERIENGKITVWFTDNTILLPCEY
jgi:hypothetical protein